jgi:hypothetical protein
MENNNQGLFHKYDIKRTDGKDLPGEKHQDCEYFVLDLTHDKHAAYALMIYALSCKRENPVLSRELLKKANAMTDNESGL